MSGYPRTDITSDAVAEFDLIVLDFDGTLVDSQDLLVGLVNDILAATGLPRADPTDVAATIGLPLDQVFRRAVPVHVTDASMIDRLCSDYRLQADHMDFVRRFRLFPDVVETLRALRAAGIHLVIGTSKTRATTCDIVRHCGIADLIDDIIGGDCVRHGKPHPEMVERARSRWKAAAARTLMVGDTPFDLRMGQAAGVAVCAVTYGMHSAEALRTLHPHFLIDRFADLPRCVGVEMPAR